MTKDVEKMINELVEKMDVNFGLPGCKNYILATMGAAIDVAHHEGNIYDLDGIVALSKALGFQVSYELYSFINSRTDDISLLEINEQDECTMKRLEHLVRQYAKQTPVELRVEGAYLLGTVDAIAEHITKMYLDSADCCMKFAPSQFRSFDFTVADEVSPDASLETIAYSSSMWHGVKAIPNTGFDSDELSLLADYYGGGSGAYGAWYPGMTKQDATRVLKDIMSASLTKSGSFKEDWVIIAQIAQIEESE